MREVKLVKKLYQFDELYEDIKDEVIDEHRYINIDDSWYEYIVEDFFLDTYIRYGIEFNDIEFDLGRDKFLKVNNISVNHDVFLNRLLIEGVINKRLYDKLKRQSDKFTIDIKCYKYAVEVIITDYSEVDRKGYLVTDYLEREVDLESWFKHNIVNRLLNILEDFYNSLISDEYIIETLKANDYEFTVDGKIFNEYEYEVEEKYIMKEKENERN